MKKFLLNIVTFVSLSSCCETYIETTYSYKEVEILRTDRCGKTIFSYTEDGIEANRIWVEYSGINDKFSGYLEFEDNGRVTLLSSDGFFQSESIDSSIFKFQRLLSPEQKPKLGKRVYFIQLSTRYEKERNSTTGTEVKAEYFN